MTLETQFRNAVARISTTTEGAINLDQFAEFLSQDYYWQEDVFDFLDDNKIPYYSHSRLYLTKLALQKGWRPVALS